VNVVFSARKVAPGLERIWVVKGGQFGLSLGRLLSKGGMMSRLPGSPAPVGQRPATGRTGETEE